jgi:hypothetical protein
MMASQQEGIDNWQCRKSAMQAHGIPEEGYVTANTCIFLYRPRICASDLGCMENLASAASATSWLTRIHAR